MAWRVGVDIGGTFTDVALVDDASGAIGVAKVPTTPRNLAEGVLGALASAMQRYGLKPAEVLPAVVQDPGRQMFQQMLFSKIVPNCKKLGLLDAGDGWLRTKFTEMGVIQFEDWQDTGEEYESLQATG